MKICECVTVHRPVLTRTVLFAFPMKGGKPKKVWLCPTTYDAVIELGKLYDHHVSTPPWSERRRYPEYARRIAAQAFGNP